MLKKLNAAMDYIEAHLEEDFRLEEVQQGWGLRISASGSCSMPSQE